MNIKKLNNKLYKYESYWRANIKDKSKDDNGHIFPYPKYGKPWSLQLVFINRLLKVQRILEKNNRFKKTENKNCLLCDKKKITTGEYMMSNIIWEDGLVHYIKVHNVKPSDEFIDAIYRFSKVKEPDRIVKFESNMYRVQDLKYIKFDKNHILILDALMIHGGETKKYVDKNDDTIYRYSEHAGLINFNETGVDRIIISGKTSIIDNNDEEIYLPKNIPDAYDYEYIFHTHPPTPRAGGRAEVGILYEFPSISDIFHFMEHYNNGKTQGSIVITPEGLYNIRSKNMDFKKIKIDEDKLFESYNKIVRSNQTDAIKFYGTKFNTEFFYSTIAQNVKYIKKINTMLATFNLHIDYFPRSLNKNGQWAIDTIYLPIQLRKRIKTSK